MREYPEPLMSDLARVAALGHGLKFPVKEGCYWRAIRFSKGDNRIVRFVHVSDDGYEEHSVSADQKITAVMNLF
jgi:hypothetical protein